MLAFMRLYDYDHFLAWKLCSVYECMFLSTELESIASQPQASKPYLMSPSEAKFLAHLITRHGSNYKVGGLEDWVWSYTWAVCIVHLV